MPDFIHRLFLSRTTVLVTTLAFVVILLHFVYFVIIPSIRTRGVIRDPRLRRYLERVVATPSLLGDSIRIAARHNLLRLSLMEGLHEQAVTQGFALLRHRLPGGFAAEIRGRLADALEGVGRLREANEQRLLARADLKEAPKDPAWYVTRGRQLTAARDYAGAIDAFEQGLAITPVGGGGLLTLSLANALYSAGRVEEAAERAEEATKLGGDTKHLLHAHRLAGTFHGSVGRLNEAERHGNQALELAQSLGDVKEIADAFVGVAMIQHKQGKLKEAFATCDRACAEARPTRLIEAARFDILRLWGRWDEALAALDRAEHLDPLAIVRNEAKMKGVQSYSRARMFMEKNSLNDAETQLEAARAALGDDPKFAVWCDAAAVRLAALQGRRDEALLGLDQFEHQLAEFAQDPNTGSAILGNLGRAALVLGEFSRARDFWQAYLDLPPPTVEIPLALYHLGEAHRGLGDDTSARACYSRAVATGLDTHDARLAQARLRKLFLA